MEKSVKPIGIIGGTHFDAQLGVAFFRQYGMETVGAGISATPEEAASLQMLYPFRLQQMVVQQMKEMRLQGIQTICIYCNSMSTAIHSKEAGEEAGVRVVTPLDVYRQTAHRYSRLGVLAANCQSLGGIEKVIQEQNEKAHVIGTAMLQLAIEIEKETDPRFIIKSLGLLHLIRFYEAAEVDVLILGCTHFPYLQKTLEGLTDLHLINPAKEMVQLCQNDPESDSR